MNNAAPCGLCGVIGHRRKYCPIAERYETGKIKYRKLPLDVFNIIKDRQGRGWKIEDIQNEVGYTHDKICDAFGSPDFEYYKVNYAQYEYDCSEV